MAKLSKSSIVALIVIGLSVPLLHLLDSNAREIRKDWPLEEQYVSLPSPSAARWVYAGYNQLAADITWARALTYYGSGFVGDGDFRYLAKFVRNILALDPYFRRVYEWAAYSITVTPDRQISTSESDIRQSIEFLEQGMQYFPNNYEFFWLAGVRYFLDLKSDDPKIQQEYKEHGARLMEMAMEKPDAPKDLATKAAGFRYKLGQLEQAKSNLMQMILTTDDPKARKTMLRSLKALSDEGLADELKEATKEFSRVRLENLQQVSPHLFILLNGPPPASSFDLEELASPKRVLEFDKDLPLDLFPRNY